MRIPSQLSKGLSEEQTNQLERELKSSLLVKQLRANLKDRISTMEISEENMGIPHAELAHYLGKRRGYRDILNLLPEE